MQIEPAPLPDSSNGGFVKTNEKKTLGIIFFTVFLDLVGFGIIIPIQPFYAETMGASPSVITLLGGSFSLMQFLFAPVWGRLSDRIGRRPVMLISLSASTIGYLLFGLSGTLGMLFFSRMLAGFGSANIGTAQAIIADSTTPETRAKGMGLIGAAFGLGFILGPALGGAFGQVSLATPAFVASFLCAINWVIAFYRLPETNPPEKRAKMEIALGVSRLGFNWASLRKMSRHPAVAQIFFLYLFVTTAFSLMEQVLGLFIEKTWLSAEGQSGAFVHAKHAAALTTYVLMCVGITATVVQGGLIGRLVKRFGETQLLLVGTFLVALSLFCIPISGALKIFGLLVGISAMMAVGTGMVNPSLSSLLSKSVNIDEQGGALGIGQSLGALGRVFGPAMAGGLFEIGSALPFWVGSGIMFCCSLVALGLRKVVAGKPATEA